MIKQNYFHLPGYIIQDSPPSLSQRSNSTEKMVAGANIDCFWNKFFYWQKQQRQLFSIVNENPIKRPINDLGNDQMTRCNISKKLAKGNKGIKEDQPHLKELGSWMDGSFFQAKQTLTSAKILDQLGFKSCNLKWNFKHYVAFKSQNL